MSLMEKVNLHGTMDGKLWADEFMRIFGDRKQDIDAGLMLGWFCNAIMVGHDFGAAQERERAVRETAKLCAEEAAKHFNRERERADKAEREVGSLKDEVEFQHNSFLADRAEVERLRKELAEAEALLLIEQAKFEGSEKMVESLRKELDDTKKFTRQYWDEKVEAHSKVDSLERELGEMQDALTSMKRDLAEYCTHHYGCNRTPCDCGLEALLSRKEGA